MRILDGMSFELKIKLGNEVMQTPEDVAEALTRIADAIRSYDEFNRTIRDLNGNIVGECKLV